MSHISYIKWCLSAQGDDGEEFEIATEWHQSDLPRRLVYDQMMEAHWDPRLDAACCVPILTKLE